MYDEASASDFASNPYGVEVQPLEYTPGNYAPTTKTYHGIAIVVNNNIVGRINSWGATRYSRTGVFIRELNPHTFGRPVDYVPGIGGDPNIACARVEVWMQEMERAFGYSSTWVDLCDQTRPFVCRELLYRGSELYEIWSYFGCWFQEKNLDPATSDGDTVYRTNATIAYVSCIRSYGLA